MAYLVLVRHGQSEANLLGIVAGQIDTPLTDQGKQEARKIAELLRDFSFEHLYSSTLMRAKETLKEICSVLEIDLATRAVDALKEKNWGITEGTAVTDADTRAQEEIKGWFSLDGRVPGGETFREVSDRATQFLTVEVMPSLVKGEDCLVVSHRGTLKMIRRFLEDIPYEKVGAIKFENCEAFVYEFDENGSIVSTESRIAK